MIWSSFVNGKYAELLVKFAEGSIEGSFTHLPPIIDFDGGHGMLFYHDEQLYLTYHSPNVHGMEKPVFMPVSCDCEGISLL